MQLDNDDTTAGGDNSWADLDTPASEAALMGEPEPGGGAGADDGGGENADNHGDGAGSEGSGADGENGDGGSGADDLDLDLLSAIAEDDDTQQRRDPVIPRARFDEVNNARREAEARAAELEAEVARLAAERAAQQQGQGQAQPGQPADGASAGGDAKGAEPFDFDAKESEFLDAQWEGDKERALAIRREINEAIRRQVAEDAAQQALRRTETAAAEKEAARTAQEQASAAQKAADAVAARLPALFENDGKNQAMADFAEWRDFYLNARGMTPAEAITAAADRVAKQYETPAKEATPAADPATDPRTQKAIERGAETSSRQPPPLGESGTGNRTAPPVPKIDTQEDWERLPEKERERLLMQGS